MCACIAGFESRDAIGCYRDARDVLRKANIPPKMNEQRK